MDISFSDFRKSQQGKSFGCSPTNAKVFSGDMFMSFRVVMSERNSEQIWVLSDFSGFFPIPPSL